MPVHQVECFGGRQPSIHHHQEALLPLVSQMKPSLGGDGKYLKTRRLSISGAAPVRSRLPPHLSKGSGIAGERCHLLTPELLDCLASLGYAEWRPTLLQREHECDGDSIGFGQLHRAFKQRPDWVCGVTLNQAQKVLDAVVTLRLVALDGVEAPPRRGLLWQDLQCPASRLVELDESPRTCALARGIPVENETRHKMVPLLLRVARPLAPTRTNVVHGLSQRHVVNRSRPISRTSHRVQQHRARQLRETHANRSSKPFPAEPNRLRSCLNLDRAEGQTMPMVLSSFRWRSPTSERTAKRTARCSLRSLCVPESSEHPRNAANTAPRVSAFSGDFARIRWYSQVVNQSGRPDSNRGPRRPERRALPGCATPRRAPQYPTPLSSRPSRPLAPGPAPSLHGPAPPVPPSPSLLPGALTQPRRRRPGHVPIGATRCRPATVCPHATLCTNPYPRFAPRSPIGTKILLLLQRLSEEEGRHGGHRNGVERGPSTGSSTVADLIPRAAAEHAGAHGRALQARRRLARRQLRRARDDRAGGRARVDRPRDRAGRARLHPREHAPRVVLRRPRRDARGRGRRADLPDELARGVPVGDLRLGRRARSSARTRSSSRRSPRSAISCPTCAP